ncbi:MAG: carboxypeptidase regulatory-like domain-containing protein [Gemmatimonadaceae bacterium]
MRDPLVRVVAPLALALLARAAAAQAPREGTLVGTVQDEEAHPVEGARVRAERRGGAPAREALTDARGAFRIPGLPVGIYALTVRRIGFREAELTSLRLAADSASVRVTLSRAPRRLSTVVVETSPVAVDADTPELFARLERDATVLLPSGRDASSLTALVPGARKDALWGGAGGAANDYRLDGVSVSHPGLGGDFLVPSVDWIDALEVRGPAAGAEYGNFQGGIVNAVTRTGTNRREVLLRTNYESPRLTATNFNLDEQGSEQAGRREVAGEALGPIARDRLFYFLAGQLVRRELRAPNLQTAAGSDFLAAQESHDDLRALGKLTWLPALGERVDVLLGTARGSVERAGLNGLDDPSSAWRVHAPTTFYEATWTRARRASSTVDVRVAGFTAREARRGYEGGDVPGVQLFRLGRQPTYVNAAFDERREPASLSGSATWTGWGHALGAEHRLVLGGEATRGTWHYTRTRNGGVTWRPYATGQYAALAPDDAATWGTTASEWGGETRLHSDVASGALFAQDYVSLGTRVTLAPGLRLGSWAGGLTPACAPAGGERCRGRITPVWTAALAPRIGAAWDVTGRGDLALKAHWGRFHQGMQAHFFDRAEGANAYTNRRFYYFSPPLSDASATFTEALRDSLTGPGGFSPFYDDFVSDEAGRVEGYKQPYVDQTALGVEKGIGAHWKAEALYLHRVNRNIVGLLDRNLAANFQVLHNVKVEHRLGFGEILDAKLQPLVLPEVYISNADIIAMLEELIATDRPARILGFTGADIPRLQTSRDLVLTTLPGARRRYDQLTVALRSEYGAWRGQGSVTFAKLRGNVAGATGHGIGSTGFTAGPFVRPNEAINFAGNLPDAMEMEAKLWAAARLPGRAQAGVVVTHILGERFTPTFELAGRYRYVDSTGSEIPVELFRGVAGQTIFLESRGSRQYASRTNVDLHVEWRPPARLGDRLLLAADVFNLTGSDAIVLVKTNADDQERGDAASYLGAPRLRVPPRTVRLGLRIE